MLLIDLKILITYSVNFSLLRQWTEKVVLLPFINIMSKNQWLNGPNQRCLTPTIKNIRKQHIWMDSNKAQKYILHMH